MLIPVLYISTLVHIFSVDYMANDPFSGDKLPKSGNFLKTTILSYNRKTISGWSNYPGTVISCSMILCYKKSVSEAQARQ